MTASRPELQPRLRGSTSASVHRDLNPDCLLLVSTPHRELVSSARAPPWGCFFWRRVVCTRSWKPRRPGGARTAESRRSRVHAPRTLKRRRYVGLLARLAQRKGGGSRVCERCVRHWRVCVSRSGFTRMDTFIHGGCVGGAR